MKVYEVLMQMYTLKEDACIHLVWFPFPPSQPHLEGFVQIGSGYFRWQLDAAVYRNDMQRKFPENKFVIRTVEVSDEC